MATRLDDATGLSLRGLWSWWLGELRGLLPARPWRPPARPEAVIVLYEPSGIDIVVRRRHRMRKLGRLPLPEPGNGDAALAGVATAQETRTLLRAVRQARLPIVLRLPAAMGIVRRDRLPASAERELGSIMAHKIDVLTPWTVDQVHFDQRIDGRRDDGQIEVSLVAAPRGAVAEARRRLATIGLETRGVDLVEDDPLAAPSVDLTHAIDTAHPRSRWGGVLLWLGIILFTAGGVAAGHHIVSRQAIVAERRELVLGLEQRLADMPDLRASLEALRNETRFVAEQQREAASPLVVLESLSRILPDGVWLTDVSISGKALSIQGYADDVAGIVGLIEAAPQFARAEFRSPSTRERVLTADGVEREVSRFSVAAVVEPVSEVAPMIGAPP
jgi:general secretion pathway protein L